MARKLVIPYFQLHFTIRYVFYEDLDDPLLKDRGIQKYLFNMNEEYHQTPKELIVSDYLSGMTDTYLLEYYKKVFLPTMRENII